MCAILGFTSPSLKKEQVLPYFEKTKSRGPDDTRLEPAGSGMLGFHRLAIMGLHPEGMQPFHRGGDMAVCNGELYGFRPVKKALEAKGYVFASDSDCEIILPLWQEYGTDMFAGLDAEFAMIIYDSASDSLVAARDPIGIRPLFYGYLADGSIIFASEAKNLVGLCAHVFPFPPGHYYKDGKFVRYADLTTVTRYSDDDLDTVTKKIREKLISAVEKRLDADAPLGFLLSGGVIDTERAAAIVLDEFRGGKIGRISLETPATDPVRQDTHNAKAPATPADTAADADDPAAPTAADTAQPETKSAVPAEVGEGEI